MRPVTRVFVVSVDPNRTQEFVEAFGRLVVPHLDTPDILGGWGFLDEVHSTFVAVWLWTSRQAHDEFMSSQKFRELFALVEQMTTSKPQVYLGETVTFSRNM